MPNQHTPSYPGTDHGMSPSEKAVYFAGIASNSRLVARTSRERFVQQKGLKKRQSDQIGLHPVTDVYKQEDAREKIRKLFLNDAVPQALTDLLRIGYSTSVDKNPVIFLVKVAAGSISCDKAQQLVDDIHGVFRSYGINDVEVEVMELKVAGSATKTT